MAKIDLEAHLEINKGAAEHAEVIRQTLGSLDDLRSKGLTGRHYSLVPPFGRRPDMPVSNQGKIPVLPRNKMTFPA